MANGSEISLQDAKLHVQKYLDINAEVTQRLINHIQQHAQLQAQTKNFFRTINLNNTFVFDADRISRFFDKPTQPTHFIVSIGGALAGSMGDATVVVAGCTQDGNRFKVLPELINPASQHPGKRLVPATDITAFRGAAPDDGLSFLMEVYK